MKKLLFVLLSANMTSAVMCSEVTTESAPADVAEKVKEEVAVEAVASTVVKTEQCSPCSEAENKPAQENVAHVDLTVQVVKNDGSVVSDTVRFAESNTRYEIDGMTFEVVTSPDQEAGSRTLDLKIYRKNEQGDDVLLCQGNGKIAVNKEEVVQITEKNNEEEVVQTMTLTFLVTE